LTDQGGQVEVTAERHGDTCLLRVEDNGRGLEQEQAYLLLEPFAAGRAPGACGAGLGFLLVRQAIACWGGAVRVSSRPGLGTTVELLIPLRDQE
jgi:signal transduction histidine kinase